MCQLTGQPVLIGGTMGTCSYVLTGTETGMMETFGTTCHGAVSIRSLAIVSDLWFEWQEKSKDRCLILSWIC